MDYLVSYSFYSSASPQTKSKSIKKHRLQATALTSREQIAITTDFFVKIRKIYPIISMLYTEKSVLRYYVRVFTDLVT